MQRTLSIFIALALAGGLAVWMLTGNLVISGASDGASNEKLHFAALCEQKKAGELKKSDVTFWDRTVLGLSCKPEEEVQISAPFLDLCQQRDNESLDISSLTDVEKTALNSICDQPKLAIALDYKLEDDGKEKKSNFKVQTINISPQERTENLIIRGQTAANAKIEIRSETNGIVETIHFEKGNLISAGDLLCSIEPGARASQLQQAKASLSQIEFDYNNGKTLLSQGHITQSRLQQLRSSYDAALAQVKSAEIEMDRLKIYAKVNGIANDPASETGDFLSVGSTCVTLLQNDPLLGVAQVSEQDIGNIKIGTPAEIQLINGVKKSGIVSYISSQSDPATRTFRVEVKIPNEDLAIKDGLTAQVALSLPPIQAYQIPPNAITLNEEGKMGVKTVNNENLVGFEPLTILAEDANSIWATGPKGDIQVITVGQDYVIADEEVIPVIVKAEMQ